MPALGYRAALAQGTSSWLSPTLMGVPADNPAVLPYWLGAWAMQWAPAWVNADFVARIPFAGLLILAMVGTWYGTYYLARSPLAQLFEDIAWGTASVMQETRTRLARGNWRWHELAPLWDVDRPEDLQRLRQLRA